MLWWLQPPKEIKLLIKLHLWGRRADTGTKLGIFLFFFCFVFFKNIFWLGGGGGYVDGGGGRTSYSAEEKSHSL